MFKTLIHALRVGGTVKNPTSIKWVGVAVAAGIVVLEIAKSYGFFVSIDESSMIELIMAGVILYTQFATTDKIGILPKEKQIEAIESLEEDYTPIEEPAIQQSKKPSSSNGGFPDGPFFSN